MCKIIFTELFSYGFHNFLHGLVQMFKFLLACATEFCSDLTSLFELTERFMCKQAQFTFKAKSVPLYFSNCYLLCRLQLEQYMKSGQVVAMKSGIIHTLDTAIIPRLDAQACLIYLHPYKIGNSIDLGFSNIVKIALPT